MFWPLVQRRGRYVPRRLTDRDTNDTPAYSPDGTKIAFARQTVATNAYDLFTMNTNGSDKTRLTSAEADDWHPSWGPALAP